MKKVRIKPAFAGYGFARCEQDGRRSTEKKRKNKEGRMY